MPEPRRSLKLKVVAERVEEDAEVSERVSCLEAEADREIAERRPPSDPSR